jgi:hypothetical protein
MDRPLSRRFDPIDFEYMRFWVQLSAAAHLQAMLDAREFTLGAIRSRVRRLYPDVPPETLGLKIVEEIARGDRAYTRPAPVL